MSTLLQNIDDAIKFVANEYFNEHKSIGENTQSTIECGSISTCGHLKRLGNVMTQHIEMNKIDMSSLLDNFIHLINYHCDNDDAFEYIYNTMGVCDISKCKSFRRNYRDRKKCRNNSYRNELYSSNNNTSHIDIIRQQIFDKIHCYFCHCFDIGNRLSL
eukprot:471396_1